MKSILPIAAAASIAIAVSACASNKTKPDPNAEKPKEAPVEGPKLVGRVASVPSEKKFILIQSYGKWEQESGQILTTRGPENRTANLRVTGEKLGDFAAADVQAGTIEVGDAVYSQHVPKPVTTPSPLETPSSQAQTPPETPLPQGEAPPGNVQKNN